MVIAATIFLRYFSTWARRQSSRQGREMYLQHNHQHTKIDGTFAMFTARLCIHVRACTACLLFT
jgi:hypothetical protein